MAGKIMEQLTADEAETLAWAAAAMGPFIFSQGFDIRQFLTPQQVDAVHKAAHLSEELS